jgi:DNA uptake protein ComE-like DNA-binding protein
MVTTSERRALVLVAVLLCLGVAARVGRATRARPEPTAAERKALDAQIARVESARVTERAKSGRGGRATRNGPSRPDERSSRAPARGAARDESRTLVDVDRASAAELERLPYVGRVLAERVVANRDSCGAFGSLEALTRVNGVGPALAKRLAPLVTFSEASRPMDAVRPPGCARADQRAALRRRGRP